MKPEKQQLIHDLLGGEEMRDATLMAGARMLRRRRNWRVASQGLMLGLVVTAMAVWFERTNASRHSTAMLAAAPSAAVPLKTLTDDQLLALFPDTPVGLMTLPDGHKRLVFPRTGDTQKFFARL